MRISDEQLSTIIADQIRERGLNGVFDDTTMASIKEKLKNEYKRMRAAPMETLIPEGDANPPTSSTTNTFPYEDDELTQPSVAPDAGIAIAPALEAGAEPTDQAYPPKAFTPELPQVLKDMEPAKLVVMELGDIIENGENLSNKPFRSMDNIDMKMSMMDAWKNEGRTKAEIYIIKYERAGDMTYDYANGTAVFVPVSSSEAVTIDASFKNNPYKDANPNGPSNVVGPTEEEIETYVKTSVNVEDIVKKVAMEMMAKAHEEQTKLDARSHLGLAQPEAPEPTEWEAQNVPTTLAERPVTITMSVDSKKIRQLLA